MVALSKRIPLLVTALVLSAQPAFAAPLPGASGGFGIAPARRHVIGSPGMQLTPTTVINDSSSSYQVSVFPAILTQELSGAFDFADTPRNLNDSKLALSTSADSFVLPPGSTRQVSLRWNLLPRGQKWLAMGVVFQGVAEGQSGPVHVVSRLLSVNFLSLPGLTTVNGAFTGLYAEQFAPRVLRFLARVENTGDRFSAPSAGRLVLRDSLGNVVFSGPWTGDVVLPGAQRDFPIDVRKVLPAGRYTATVTMRFGGERSRSTAFTLVGPNQLPTPAITIRDFNATGVIGSPAKVTARILSSGTAPAGLTLHLYLAHASDAAPGATALATAQISYRNLVPGSVTRLSHPLGGGLHAGSYRVIATWVDPTGAQHTAQADFTPTAGQALSQAIWSFIRHHLVFLIGLLVLALVMAMAYIVRRLRGGQRQIQAELAAVRAQLDAVRLDARATAEKPAAARPSRVRTGTSTRGEPKARSSGTRPSRSRTPVDPSGAKPNGASAGTKSTAAKAGAQAKAAGKKPTAAKPGAARANGARANGAKANGAKANGAKPTGARTNGANANGVKPTGARANGAKSNGVKPAGARANAAKPNGVKPAGARENGAKPSSSKPAEAKPNAAKATEPRRRPVPAAGAPTAGNGAKPSAAKASGSGTGTSSTGAKAAGVRPNRRTSNGAKANGAKANGAKANGAKANGDTSNGAKVEARSRSTGVKSNPAPSSATPAQPESLPSSQNGTGAELRSTEVRANRAGELLALASRSHARRPLPTDQDDA